MKNIFILILFLTAYGLSAQVVDKPSGGIAIPKTENNTTITPPETNAPSIFSPTPEKNKPSYYPSFEVGAQKDNFSMILEDKFVNRSSEYTDRTTVKPRGESNEAFKGNQFFGEYKSGSEFVQVLARDFEYEDGDRIKVLVNGRIIIPELTLTNDFKGVQITLEPGFNKIDFEALNQGTSGPNTAEFRIYDDKEDVVSSNQWNLATGFKATVIIVKE